VRVRAQAVDDQDRHAGEAGNGLGKQAFGVGDVGDLRGGVGEEEEADGLHGAVFHRQWFDRDVAALERAVDDDRVGPDVAAVVVFRGEGPAEHAAEFFHAIGGGVEWQRLLAVPAEGAQVIEADDVVEVAVGVEHGVDRAEVFAQGLFAQVGTGIDEQGGLRGAHHGRGAGACIARVVRAADRAIAADHGHPDRGAGAEEEKLESAGH
jgi:hypothetical protein